VIRSLQQLLGPAWAPWIGAQRQLLRRRAAGVLGIGLGTIGSAALCLGPWAPGMGAALLVYGVAAYALAIGFGAALTGWRLGRRALRSAGEFLQEDAGASVGLRQLHVQQTQARLQQVDLPGRLRAQYRQPLRRLRNLCCGSGLLAVGLLVGLPQSLHALRAAWTGTPIVEWTSDPLLTDFDVLYTYPEHTQLPPRRLQHVDGDVRALVGSRADLSGRAAPGVAGVGLWFEPAPTQAPEDQPKIPAAEIGAAMRRLEPAASGRQAATLHLQQSGRYHLMAQARPNGPWVLERLGHRVEVLPDRPPEVALQTPGDSLQLRSADSLVVQWRATDDFGLSSARLRIGDHNRLLWEAAADANAAGRAPPKAQTQRQILSVSELDLPPGIGQDLQVEACDNAPEPQCSRSPPVQLTLYSEAAVQMALLEQQQGVLASLIDGLGALLVPTVKTPIRAALQNIRDLLAPTLAALQAEPLAPVALAQANAQLLAQVDRSLAKRRRPMAEPAARAQNAQDVGSLQHHILYLDDLLTAGRLADLQQTAKALLSAQTELRGLLAAYRSHPEPQLKQQLMQRIAQGRRRMLELLQKMSQLRAQLPEAYRNVEAATGAAANRNWEELEKALQSDSLDAAAASLDQLAEDVARMVESFGDAEKDVGSSRYAEQRGAMAALGKGLRQLRDSQRHLVDQTAELRRATRAAALARQGGEAAVRQAQKKALQASQRAFKSLQAALPHPPAALDPALGALAETLDNLELLLQRQDVAEAQVQGLRAARAAANLPNPGPAAATRATRQLQQHTAELAERLGALMLADRAPVSAASQPKLATLRSAQASTEQQAKTLLESVQALQKSAPLVDEASQAGLERAAAAMGRAVAALGSSALSDAQAAQGVAMEALDQLAAAAQRAQQGAGSGGMPSPLSMAEPKAGGSGPPAGGNSQPGNQSGGGQADSQQAVEIPKGINDPANEKFRQDVLDAARQPPPPAYKEAVRHYYEELLR
jgi:hypothetical protein